jgi:hypothetical protein
VQQLQIEREDGSFCVEASLLGELLNVPPSDVQTLMRSNAITSTCERGEGIHLGRFRLTFFYGGRRLRLEVDEAGCLLRRPFVRQG